MSRFTPMPGDETLVRDLGGVKHRLTIKAVKRYKGTKGGKTVNKAIPIYGDEIMNVLVEDIRFRTKHKYDNVILITGEERTGKSNTAIRLAKMLDPTFDVDRILFDVYGDINHVMRSLDKPGRVLVLDEAGREINSRQWSKKEQKELVTKFQVFGKLGATVILVMPRMSYLDSAIRDTRLKFWIQVKAKKNGMDRGYIFWKEAKRDDYTNKTFFQTRYAGKIYPPHKFPELVPMMEAYEAKKDAYIQSVLTPVEDDKNAFKEQRNKLIWFIVKAKGASVAEIETLTGLKSTTIRGITWDTDQRMDDNIKFLLGFINEVSVDG